MTSFRFQCSKYAGENMTSPTVITTAKEAQNFYQIKKLEEDTYHITDIFGDYIYLLMGTETAALIDTGMGLPGLLHIIRTLTSKPIIVLHTHGHLDHVGGDHEFEEIYLHPNDESVFAQHRSGTYRQKISTLAAEAGLTFKPEILADIISPCPAVKTKPFTEETIFQLGGRQLEVIETPGHTQGSVCFLDRQRKQLYSGDTVCAIGVMLSFPCSTPIEVYLASLHKLQSMEPHIKAIYPGHHKVPLDTTYFTQYTECAKALLRTPSAGTKETSVFGTIHRFNYREISLTY